jgi:indolepyruvate decarboxylase
MHDTFEAVDRAPCAAYVAPALATSSSGLDRFELIELLLAPGDCTPTLRRFSDGIRALRAGQARAA